MLLDNICNNIRYYFDNRYSQYNNFNNFVKYLKQNYSTEERFVWETFVGELNAGYNFEQNVSFFGETFSKVYRTVSNSNNHLVTEISKDCYLELTCEDKYETAGIYDRFLNYLAPKTNSLSKKITVGFYIKKSIQ